MNKEMWITTKSVYGQERYYPSCELASKFSGLLGVKTFTLDKLKIIKSMGIEIKVKQNPITI